MSPRLPLFAAGLLLTAAAAPAAEPRLDSRIELGRRLFEESWLRPPADDSPLEIARSGDGLGPLFNGASCAECHRQGGVGGAGPSEHNVEVVSLALPLDAPPATVRAAMATAAKGHTGFLKDTNLFLHRFGLDGNRSAATYAAFRDPIRNLFPEEILPAIRTQITLGDGLPYQIAQRNTTALWGLGLIERIPPKLVTAVAERQRQSLPKLAGVATDGGAGRFGWRGHVSTIERFVRTACANELGMRVKDPGGAVHDQAPWPIASRISSRGKNPPADLTPKQVDALVEFVRALPAPRAVVPEDDAEAAAAEKGRFLFDTTGCSICHVPDMGPAAGVYSDMLLHDMGPTFADRVAAPLDQAKPRVVTKTSVRAVTTTTGGGGYGGSSSTSVALVPTTTAIVIPPSLGDLTLATQAFRTPPLWGVADSAPYLHDGRAETLDDAIRLHGGQAESSAQAYAALPTHEQAQLLAFLRTLKAPQQNTTDTTTEPLN